MNPIDVFCSNWRRSKLSPFVPFRPLCHFDSGNEVVLHAKDLGFVLFRPFLCSVRARALGLMCLKRNNEFLTLWNTLAFLLSSESFLYL